MALPPSFDPTYVDDKTDHLELTSMRVHELAVQWWLNKTFFFSEGYPLPVIFATPRDAHHEFLKLWKLDNNPFRYLLDLKDKQGRQVYQPYPSNVIYPLIGVTRLNWSLRPSQSYGYHLNRRAYYPTVADNVNLEDLAWATALSMPVGWDFHFQIDHYCNAPQTQAIFINRLMRALRMSGGSAQTFIPVRYQPPHHTQPIRLYLNGDIQNVTADAQPDANQEIRTSFNITVEGYWLDYIARISPVMWYFGLTQELSTVAPDLLQKWFDVGAIYPGLDDVRVGQANPAVLSQPNLPPSAAT